MKMDSLMNSVVNSCDTTRNNHWSVSNKLPPDTENGLNVISTNVGDKENTIPNQTHEQMVRDSW